MWRATLKGLLAHKVRLGLTALSIVLGVAFVSGTYILTDTIGKAFDGLFQTVNQGVAVVVQGEQKFVGSGAGGQPAGPGERVPASLLETIQQVPGVRAVAGSLVGYAQVVGKDGKAVSTGGAPTLGASWITDPQLAVTTLRQGRAPEREGEVAMDVSTADKAKVGLGDQVKILLQGPPMEATIVGIFSYGNADSLGGATFVAFDEATAQTTFHGEGRFDSVRVAAENGVSPSTLRARIQGVLPPGYQANTGQQQAAADAQDIKDALGFFNIALLVFAGIALFVGAFIIFNTFSILVAQRTRELALLRALGASPGQVRRSVMAEAIIVGLLASAVGLAAGFGIAVGLQGLLKAFGIDLPSTGTQFLPRTVIAAMVVGTVTTFVASIAPAFRASRVPPIAALRDAEPATYVRSRRRTLVGLVVLAVGVGILLFGLFGGAKNAPSLVGVGAAVVFFGVTVLSPLVAQPLSRAIGAPFARLGISGKLGRENAMRNPKRTSSTAAALMIGMALVAFVSIFGASIKASATAALDATLKADYIVSTLQFNGFSQDVANQLRGDERFGTVAEFRGGVFGIDGHAEQVEAVDPATIPAVANVSMGSGSLADLGPGGVLVYSGTATSHGWKVGDPIQAEFARTGKQMLKIVGIYTDNRLLGSYVISLPTYDANFTEQLDNFLLLRTAPGVSPAEAKAAVDTVAKAFPNVKLQDQAGFRKSQADAVNKLLGLITALLGLALIIALFGIVNTLALSVYERTREIGLLRAVGLARRQTRAMVRWESVIIAVFGAVLGTAVGMFFGWAMVRALKGQGISELAFPAGQLLFYIVLAGLAGVLAAVGPARRAAKLDVLEAITTQ